MLKGRQGVSQAEIDKAIAGKISSSTEETMQIRGKRIKGETNIVRGVINTVETEESPFILLDLERGNWTTANFVIKVDNTGKPGYEIRLADIDETDEHSGQYKAGLIIHERSEAGLLLKLIIGLGVELKQGIYGFEELRKELVEKFSTTRQLEKTLERIREEVGLLESFKLTGETTKKLEPSPATELSDCLAREETKSIFGKDIGR